jgi:hypothetical protein
VSDARADIRGAVRRLIAAAARDEVEVTVMRRDVEVLLATVVSGRRQARPEGPDLHPEQR